MVRAGEHRETAAVASAHGGERKEAAYGQRASEIAAELAVHFEQGREYPARDAVSAASRAECNPAHRLSRSDRTFDQGC